MFNIPGSMEVDQQNIWNSTFRRTYISADRVPLLGRTKPDIPIADIL